MAEQVNENIKAKAARKPVSLATRRKRFIHNLSITPNISKAAKLAGLCLSTAYRNRSRLPTFKADWDAAINASLDNIGRLCT